MCVTTGFVCSSLGSQTGSLSSTEPVANSVSFVIPSTLLINRGTRSMWSIFFFPLYWKEAARCSSFGYFTRLVVRFYFTLHYCPTKTRKITISNLRHNKNITSQQLHNTHIIYSTHSRRWGNSNSVWAGVFSVTNDMIVKVIALCENDPG